jgi:hypothetical protein
MLKLELELAKRAIDGGVWVADTSVSDVTS